MVVDTPLLKLGGGFKYCFIFTLKIGEDFQFDSYFSDGLKHVETIN